MLCNKDDCTGCMACFNSCKTGAITIVPDDEGFVRPKIDQLICVNCGKCEKSCPQMVSVNAPNSEKLVYACWLKDSKIRKNSTSGGAFTALSMPIFYKNGFVVGAGFDAELRVEHQIIDRERDLYKLRGSKYVQSNIGKIYLKVKELLVEEKIVLFSGTPCQVAGLYSFLGNRNYKNLFTVDIVCHGVPSPQIFEEYKNYMTKKYHSKINDIYFRNKKPGWLVFGMKMNFENGKIYEKTTYRDPFIRAFLRELCLRPSCHSCKYANLGRVSDITIADFWGYVATGENDKDDDKGISMVMINSSKGKELFDEASKELNYWERPLEQAVKGNPALSKCFLPSSKREDFWMDYHKYGFGRKLIRKYMYAEEDPFAKRKRKQFVKDLPHYIIHLPNRIIMKVIGDKNYQNLKLKVKSK